MNSALRRTVLSLPIILGVTTSCLPQRVSKLLSMPGTLNVSGRVLTSGGEPASDVLVFVGDEKEPKTTTASDGTYELTLSEADLIRLKGDAQTQRDVFYLYFQRDLPTPTVGASGAMEQKTRGKRSLDDVRLEEPAMLKGLVQVLAKGRKLEPAHEARVRVGRYDVLTKADGSFELKGLPSGRLPITATAREFAAYKDDVTLKAGSTNIHDRPIVLFDEPGISGSLILKPELQADLISSGHPYLRSFYVAESRDARYLRMSTKEADLEKANWIPVRQLVDYDFPGAGGHTLYYQFANASREDLSPVYQMGVAVDLFADAKGFAINNGSGVSNSAQVKVDILDMPLAAFRMRYAESTDDLVITPWSALQPSFLFTFDAQHMTDFLVAEKPFLRTLYLQFEDATGTQSIVFASSVLLDLFPGIKVVIGAGPETLPVVNSRLVPVTIFGLNSNITEMKITDDYGTLESEPWRRAEPSSGHLFGARIIATTTPPEVIVNGPRRLRVQFRDAAHFVSPVHEVPVYVDVFPNLQGQVFTINDNDPISNTRLVEVQLWQIPPNAKEMRLYERDPFLLDPLFTLESNLLGLSTLFTRTAQDFQNWQAIPIPPTPSPATPLMVAYYYFQFADIASNRVLFLQFRDGDGVVSGSYQQPVHIWPTHGLDAAVIVPPPPITTNVFNVTLIPPDIDPINIASYKLYQGLIDDVNQEPVQWPPGHVGPLVTQFTPIPAVTSGPIVVSVKFNLRNDTSITAREIAIMGVPPTTTTTPPTTPPTSP